MPMTYLFLSRMTKVLLLLLALAGVPLPAQTAPPGASAPALSLYRNLLNPVLKPADVHIIRQASMEHEDIHIVLSDGTLGLIRAADGRVTGAVFEGVGEILLIVPGRAERTSMALFTGSAVLEQTFTTAYLRFVDEGLVNELSAAFRPADQNDVQNFIARWQQPVRDLARADSLQLFQALTNTGDDAVRYLHARVGGTQLGIFDVFLDTNSQEQISVAQTAVNGKQAYYDIWTSFPMRSARNSGEEDAGHRPRFELSDFRLNVSVQPPTDLSAETEFSLTPRRSGQRTVILELSRLSARE